MNRVELAMTLVTPLAFLPVILLLVGGMWHYNLSPTSLGLPSWLALLFWILVFALPAKLVEQGVRTAFKRLGWRNQCPKCGADW